MTKAAISNIRKNNLNLKNLFLKNNNLKNYFITKRSNLNKISINISVFKLSQLFLFYLICKKIFVLYERENQNVYE